MGFKARNCVVFEDSPSGIKAGIASGAKVISVCTSHPVEKIRGIGTFLVCGIGGRRFPTIRTDRGHLSVQVPNLSHVKVEPTEDGKLRIIVDEKSVADDGQPKDEQAFVETNNPRPEDSDEE